MNCPRCGTLMQGGVCPECGFPVTRYAKKKRKRAPTLFLTCSVPV